MLSQYLIAGVIGIMLFFSVAVAPTIFKVLPQEWAGVYVRQFFPKYYLVLGIVCLLAGVVANAFAIKLIAFTAAILFALSLWVLTPAVNSAKDNDQTKQFNVLHGLSVGINMLVLLMLVYSFWL